jgi:flagellar hook-associated protein 3 FlgL
MMLDRQTLRSIHQNMEDLVESHRQLSTGRRIGRYSDDVAGASQELRIERRGGALETYTRNVELVEGVLSTASARLQKTSEVLTRARELATQAASESYADENLRGMAEEVDGILEQVVSDTGTTYAGQYLFAGKVSDTAPYSVTRDAEGKVSSVYYEGSKATTRVPIAPGRTSRGNFVGPDLFEREADMFGTLIQLRDAMDAGDNDAVRNLIDDLKTCQDSINTATSELGSELNGVKTISRRLDDLTTRNQEALAAVADTDVAEVSIEYQRQMAALEAVMKLAGQAMPTSLADVI